MSNQFNRIYNGEAMGCARLPVQTCLNFKISDQYMCPQVGDNNSIARSTDFALSKQANCHGPRENLGTYKCSQKVMNLVSEVKNNPDFKYSTKLVTEGGKGVAKYFIENLPKIIEQAGGASADQTGHLMSNIQRSARALGDAAHDLINKVTVGETIESFISMCQGDYSVPPRIERSLKDKIDVLKQDGELYCYMVTSLLGNVTVGEIIGNCITYLEQTQAQLGNNPVLRNCLEQGGGAVQNLMYGDINDESVYTREILNLFDSLKSTVNYLSQSFQRKMMNNGAPPRVLGYVDQIQRGLNLSLQILQHQIINQNANRQQSSTLLTQPQWPGFQYPTVVEVTPLPQTSVTREVIAEQAAVPVLAGGHRGCDEDDTLCLICPPKQCKCPRRKRKHSKKRCQPIHGPSDWNIAERDCRPFPAEKFLDPSVIALNRRPVRLPRIWPDQLRVGPIPNVINIGPTRNCPNCQSRGCLSCTRPTWQSPSGCL